jgi:hypothetical protein
VLIPTALARCRAGENIAVRSARLRPTRQISIANANIRAAQAGSTESCHSWTKPSQLAATAPSSIYGFSQRRVFRVFSYHLAQKGPAFKTPLELSLDGSTGEATVRCTNSDGKEKIESERLELTQDLANGLITTLVKNIQPGASPMTLSMVVATPKPRLVKVAISQDGEDWFSAGNSTHKTVRYALKIELKGLPGLVVPLVGKEPPDIHIWVLSGEAPAYLKSEGPLDAGGPVWRIELVSPAWKNK